MRCGGIDTRSHAGASSARDPDAIAACHSEAVADTVASTVIQR